MTPDAPSATSSFTDAGFSLYDSGLTAAKLRQSPARQAFIGFVADNETVEVIRSAFGSAFPLGLPLHRATFREALVALRGVATPETVLIDLSGEDQPLTAMVDLEAVVDPGTRVLAIGHRRDVGFYRSLTRSLGVKEYLPKPLTSEVVARDFLPWALGTPPSQDMPRGGTIITVNGVRGGVGTTTIASNLAWLIGAEMRRHTILVDTDLHTGSIALMLGSLPSSGFRTALEAPDRIDPLLIERAAQPVAERLHVLAAEEPLIEKWNYIPGAAAAMDTTLRQRYNFIIVDIALRPLRFGIEMNSLAHHHVLVINPSTIAVRNAKRRLAMAHDAGQIFHPIVVLNRFTRNDAISPAKIERELGVKVSAVIPDLPRQASHAANFGELLTVKQNKFRSPMMSIVHAVGAVADGDAA